MSMIITCPNCNKQFKINPSLIPLEGRDLKCGSCGHVWFYNKDKNKEGTLSLKEDNINNQDKSVIVNEIIEQIIDKKEPLSQNKIGDKNDKKINKTKIYTNNNKKGNLVGKFFSYLVVFIISFVALIILLDTLKTPLVSIFPGLEIILFNLFEILKDIKLFIIDLY
jgi:predicted Zn finger-like uncharacterized protein